MMGNIRIVMFKWHFILILLSFIFWKLESEYIYIYIYVYVCMFVYRSQIICCRALLFMCVMLILFCSSSSLYEL